jgi:lipopolysaccharide export system protein LptA
MRQWLGVSFCILVAGCINTSVQRLDHAVRPARSPDSVTVLLEEPQRPYNVIAVIEANAKTVFDSFDDLRKAMVAEAAKLGGEAVILVSESTDSEFVFTGNAMIESDQRNLIAEVIVFQQGE